MRYIASFLSFFSCFFQTKSLTSGVRFSLCTSLFRLAAAQVLVHMWPAPALFPSAGQSLGLYQQGNKGTICFSDSTEQHRANGVQAEGTSGNILWPKGVRSEAASALQQEGALDGMRTPSNDAIINIIITLCSQATLTLFFT